MIEYWVMEDGEDVTYPYSLLWALDDKAFLVEESPYCSTFSVQGWEYHNMGQRKTVEEFMQEGFAK